MMKRGWIAAIALLASSAAAAADAPLLSSSTIAPAPSRQLTDADRLAYKQAFVAIRTHDWNTAAATLDARPAGALTPLARAELYLAKDAPAVDGATLAALAAASPDLPEAPALEALARARGATDLALLPIGRALVRTSGPSKRQNARPTRTDAAALRLAAAIQPLLKANDGASAEPLVEAAAETLAPEALTELRQRVAWAYFLADDAASARRVATLAGGGAGDWAVQGDWVAGLAAWRAGDYTAASAAFANVAARARDAETIAAGLFWAARSDIAAGQPDRAAPLLRSASRLGETFYGLLAGATLGFPQALPAFADIPLDRSNVRAAAALIEIGEPGLADQLFRQQARIGPAEEHGALLRAAATLNLPATQLWLAANTPAGTPAAIDARYPMPAWRPSGGWRVDRALLYAHALQESQFRIDAVSRAGARGLMQLMPATARLVARHKGEAGATLDDPAVSFEYGQTYLEELASHPGTGGLLPKVIAAYNAGPNNVAAWNARPAMQGDPLLYLESIPFGETRAYVAIVLRNYWMYQREAGEPTPTLALMAAGQWPSFPGIVTRTAMRDSDGEVAANR